MLGSLFESLNERSFVVIFLSDWVPSLITIVAGGVFASILLPIWQDKSAKSKALAGRRLDIAESVTKSFQKYIVSWRRLMDISKLEQKSGLSDEQKATKGELVASRNASRDALLESLAMTRIYFSTPCVTVVTSFVEWDEERASERLDQLPGISDWRIWEADVLRSIQREVAK
ncbi:hypothetical protein CU102_12625 [Phyllobacterium brassicacearum]|uniref:DUF4760 domain-containing protein n=2 Tax=Phyllobacterium brassicacearum TaxID=314235 RepID=A0A2P7BQ90_9HYPH|nr:hypothetical protein CU102_12625 [Phyllobacterium brassicacearum]TDQ24150.1 hypothetical protein DEV91_11528 [Phyllobacterium brassicacearum]